MTKTLLEKETINFEDICSRCLDCDQYVFEYGDFKVCSTCEMAIHIPTGLEINFCYAGKDEIVAALDVDSIHPFLCLSVEQGKNLIDSVIRDSVEMFQHILQGGEA